jgi:hypothetical protein
MQSTSRRETQQCVLSHMNVGHPETIQSLVKKTGIPPERISRALIALADSGRISRTREFSRPVIWTRNTQQTQVSHRDGANERYPQGKYGIGDADQRGNRPAFGQRRHHRRNRRVRKTERAEPGVDLWSHS